MKIVSISVECLSSTPNALELIEIAGRTAYQSEPKGDPSSFIRKIIQRGHTSVLEHASVTFRIVCDRGVSHELVRHRIASFTQESTRYCNYGDGITVIQPILKTEGGEWVAAMASCEEAYLTMLEEGATPQQARHVLPLSLKTTVVMTANFRSWRNFLVLRTDKAAHPHIQIVANKIGDWFKENCPVIVEDILP